MQREYMREDKIEEPADFIQKITEMAPDIISVTELPSRNILYCNNENLALHGFSRDELMQMSLEERRNLIHPEDHGILNNYFESFGAATTDEEVHTARYRARNKNGEMLSFYVRGRVFKRNEDGSVYSILNIIQNTTEIEKAEQEILRLKDELVQKATDKYLSLFNSIDEGVVISELLYGVAGKAVDLVVLETNPSFERMMRITGTVGMHAKEIFPDVDDSWFELYARVVENGESQRFEKYLAPLDSWFELYVSRIGVSGSRYFAIVFNDITERKNAEERHTYLLKLSDAIRPLTDPLAIQSVAVDLLGEQLKVNQCHYGEAMGEYVYINHSYANGLPPLAGKLPLHGFGKKLLEELHAGRVLVCDDAATDPIFLKTESAMLASGNVGAFIAVPLVKGGEWVAILAVYSIQPRKWKPGEIELAQGTAERTWAAAQRARAEIVLEEKEIWLTGQTEAFRAAMSGQSLAASLDVLVSTVRDYTNGEARAAFYMIPPGEEELHLVAGMTEEYGRDVSGFAVGPESFACGLTMHTGEAVITQDIEKEPRWQPFLSLARNHNYRGCWSFPVRAEHGPVLGTFALYFEQPREPQPRELELAAVITHAAANIILRYNELKMRAQAEAALRENEQQLKALLQIREEFIGIASHELKTPVTSIKTYTELIAESLLTNGDTRNAGLIRKLATQVDRLKDLITALLDTNRMEEGRLVYHKEPFNVCRLIAERSEEMRIMAGKRKITVQTGGCPEIVADRDRMGQVITNLITNAIKYSPDGSEIVISCRTHEGQLWVSVADKGIGIPQRHADRIFERFYRVDGSSMSTYPGMGLGLYISSEIIRNHGGTMSVQSKEGEGSVFTFTLPAGKSE